VKVGIVGAGPAGSLLAYHLARDGAQATLFDASHPREKPCGGCVTAKALALLPKAPPDDPLPARFIDTCRLESGEGEAVEITLDQPVAIAARRELDSWLLRRAKGAGALHVAERVPMFAPSEDGPSRPLAACVVVSLGGRETTIVRPTFRQAARDAEDWIAAQRID